MRLLPSGKTFKYVYLPIEIKTRELDSKLWLASHVAARGFVCILGDKPGVNAAMEVYPSGIYYDKSISKRKTKALTEKLNKCHAIVCQDEEAGIARSDIGSFFDFRTSEENVQLVNLFFCWGKNDHDYLQKKYQDYSSRFRLTGGVRVDLWRPELYRTIYSEKINELKKKYGDYVLINSAFGVISRAEVEVFLEQSQQYGKIKKHEVANERELLLSRLSAFYQFVDMIHVLAREQPEQTFVVRPHPAESMGVWKSLIEPFDNLHLVQEGDVTPWIGGCKTLIHEGCTTAIQGVLMRKPVIAYLPNEKLKGKKLNDFPNQISIQTKTVSELIQKMNCTNGGEAGCFLHDGRLLSSRIANLSGRYAAEAIADDLKALKVPSYPHPTKAELHVRRQYNRVRTRLKKMISTPEIQEKDITRRSREEKIPGGIQIQEVERFYKRLEQISKDIGNINIVQLGSNVFEISKKYSLG